MVQTRNDVLSESVLKKMTDFANSQPKIVALYKGVDPETGTRTYYFINPSIRFDDDLSTIVNELELKIYKTNGVDIRLFTWPMKLKDIPEGDFLGECIYKCPQSKQLSPLSSNR